MADITEAVFESEEALTEVLSGIESGLGAFTADPEDPKGREKMRSVARQIASKKTAIDALGKSMVADWKNSAKRVDGMRKRARDTLDDLRDKVKRPAEEYDAEVARVAAAKAAAEEKARADAEAKRIAEIEAREREIQEREAKLREAEEAALRAQRAEAEARQREAREKAEEAARLKREQRIKEEAEARAIEQAKREAEERARREQQARDAEEAKRLKAENAKRHKDAVHKSILDDLAAIGVNNGEMILEALLAGKVSRLAIDYAIRAESP